MEVTIRPVRAADLPEVITLIAALAVHHQDSATLTLSALERDVLGPNPWVTLLVAQTEGRVQGYVALCPLAQVQYGMRGMDIHHLYVAAHLRGTGIGGRLIAHATAAATAMGCAYVTVGTYPENAAAQRLYLAAGFDPLEGKALRFRKKIAQAGS
jgi:ribosomal protein S18 acetylase RimI-like enzyme